MEWEDYFQLPEILWAEHMLRLGLQKENDSVDYIKQENKANIG